MTRIEELENALAQFIEAGYDFRALMLARANAGLLLAQKAQITTGKKNVPHVDPIPVRKTQV